MKLDKMIAKGNAAEVYQIEEDKILKLFFAAVPVQEAEREYKTARLAYEAGIPTAQVYGDLLDIDGRKGIVYEYIKGTVLNDVFLDAVRSNNTAAAEECLRKHCEIMKRCHTIKMDRTHFPSARAILDDRLETSYRNSVFTAEEHDRILTFLDSIPDSSTFIHGDFNLANVIETQNGIRLIDMGDCAVGDPLYDIVSEGSAVLEVHNVLPIPNIEQIAKERTKMEFSAALFLWDGLKKYYYSDLSENERENVYRRIHSLASVRFMLGLLKADQMPTEDVNTVKFLFFPEIRL